MMTRDLLKILMSNGIVVAGLVESASAQGAPRATDTLRLEVGSPAVNGAYYMPHLGRNAPPRRPGAGGDVMRTTVLTTAAFLIGGLGSRSEASQQDTARIVPEVVIEGMFNAAEGLTFNGEGRLFMAANRSVWEVSPDRTVRKVVDVSSNLGLAPLGSRDILMADFGPLVWPAAGPNDDGVIWRITPEGVRTAVATGIGDPNAIVMLHDGSLLVSDDFTPYIYRVTLDGVVSVFTDAVPFPNGLALSLDGNALYVAQIFERAPDGPHPVRFEAFSDRVWRLTLRDNRPAGPPELLFQTGGGSGPDGLAVDAEGRLYLSAARAGQLWRIDPVTRRGELLADGLPGLVSLAFGKGAFDRHSLYAVQARGGRLLRFAVNATGAPLRR